MSAFDCRFSRSLQHASKRRSLFATAEVARAAAALRANPELANELNWHLAAVANYLNNVDGLESAFLALDDSLKKWS